MESASTSAARPGARGDTAGRGLARRLSTETKQAFKTTEFWAFLATVVAILISAAAIKGGDSGAGTDEFIARQAWLYVAIITGAYVIGRGLAKSGSREPYDEHDRDRD
jgi:hypothetical protein